MRFIQVARIHSISHYIYVIGCLLAVGMFLVLCSSLPCPFTALPTRELSPEYPSHQQLKVTATILRMITQFILIGAWRRRPLDIDNSFFLSSRCFNNYGIWSDLTLPTSRYSSRYTMRQQLTELITMRS